MTKNPLVDEGDVTAKAAEIHREMVQREARGPGDLENAMRRLEAKYGLSYWWQWNLRYKRPERVEPGFAQRLQLAYFDMLARSVSKDVAALKTEQAKGLGDDDLESLLAEATALLARIAARKAGVK